jgi:hypothetical protein
MNNLYAANTLSRFWGIAPDVPQEIVYNAAGEALELITTEYQIFEQGGWDGLMAFILGEGQFGPEHWRLSRLKQLYYTLRPFVPSSVRPLLRRLLRRRRAETFCLGWPVEDRFVRFLSAALAAVQRRLSSARPAPFWPSGARFAFILTHDVESAAGQSLVRALADADEQDGFRASFNFVPEGYRVDHRLLAQLRKRGFEVGVHGMKHDGRLFSSMAEFERRASYINSYLREWGAVGFRAPFNHRHPEWMQSLEIEYDLSFFDSDPYETIPGGTMSIWPFFCGRFVELPYTLPQDHTLYEMYGPGAVDIWIRKVDFIAKWGGMALVNVHPDYTCAKDHIGLYKRFLLAVKEKGDYWHALPREAARWWRNRAEERSKTRSV